MKKRVLPLVTFAVLAQLLASGCGTVHRSRQNQYSAAQLQAYAEQVLEPDELELFRVPFQLNRELQDAALRVNRFGRNRIVQARDLALMILRPGDLGITYNRGRNATAIEVYETREANCISYTNLFVGMARTIGIEVYFTEVTEIDSFEKVGDTVVYNSHICAIVYEGSRHFMIDFSLRDHPQYHNYRVISDLEAVACFYNNLGSRALLDGGDAGDIGTAQRYFSLALKLYPNSPQVYNNLGVLMLVRGDVAAAERMFERALQVRPGYFAAYNNLGNIYMRRGEVDRAIGVVREAAEASPDNPYGFHALGRLYLRTDDSEAAEQVLRRALRIDRSFTEARHSLGRLYLRTGRSQEALEQFALAMRYQPDDDIARNKIEMIRRLVSEEQ